MPTNQQSGMNRLGIPNQSFQSYFPPVVPSFPTFDPYGQQGQTNFQIQNALRQQQQDFLQTSPEDGDEYVSGLSRLIQTGQVSPQAGNTLLRAYHYTNPTQRGGTGTNSRNTPFSDEGTEFLRNLYGINWAKPNAFEAVPELLQKFPNALSDPRVANAMQSVQQHALSYKQPKPGYDDEISQLPSHYQNLAGKAIANLSNSASAFGLEQNANDVLKNRKGILTAIRTLRGVGVSDERIANELAASGLDPDEWANGTGPTSGYTPTEEEKKQWFIAHGIDPDKATPAQWTQAHYGSQGAVPQMAIVPQNVPHGTNNDYHKLPKELLPPGAAGLNSAPQTPETPENFVAVGSPATANSTFAAAKSAPKKAGFEGLRQQQDVVALKKADEEAKRQEEQKQIAQNNIPLWEGAKQELLKQFKPEYSRWPVSDYGVLANALGKQPREKAFDDAAGNPVSWGQVVSALMSDPRMQDIRTGKTQPQSSPVVSTPSGNQVVVKQLGPPKQTS